LVDAIPKFQQETLQTLLVMMGGQQETKPRLACSGGHGAALFCQTRPSCRSWAHSKFQASARAGNLRLVSDDRGGT